MEKLISPNEQKLKTILKHAPIGLIEIDESGTIVEVNYYGEALLKPIIDTYQLRGDNVYPILECIGYKGVEKMQNFTGEMGVILINDLYSFTMPGQGEGAEKHFNFSITKFGTGCLMISIDDISQRRLEERGSHQAELDKAVAEGKFEIASGVLHDIGNAVVGFGSYLTRIRRLLDQNNLENLKNLAHFVEGQQTAMATALGKEKAAAMVTMLNGITKAQKDNQEELNKSITEQLNIISHIQDILNIQRQYVAGINTQDRKLVNLRSVINDCIAMLFASFSKREIAVSLEIPVKQPIIRGDRTKLMQVMLNLLKNSIDAIDMVSTEKYIKIHLGAQERSLILTVQDSGIGFDETIGAQLFNRGFTTKHVGTGLGLYNCKAIIESHSGSIAITSQGVGKGALATIKFNL